MRLEFFWIDSNYRRQGIGSKLMNYLETYAIAKKCNLIRLSTLECQAAEFYKKMAYTQVGAIPKWFCGMDEIFLWKHLEPLKS